MENFDFKNIERRWHTCVFKEESVYFCLKTVVLEQTAFLLLTIKIVLVL